MKEIYVNQKDWIDSLEENESKDLVKRFLKSGWYTKERLESTFDKMLNFTDNMDTKGDLSSIEDFDELTADLPEEYVRTSLDEDEFGQVIKEEIEEAYNYAIDYIVNQVEQQLGKIDSKQYRTIKNQATKALVDFINKNNGRLER